MRKIYFFCFAFLIFIGVQQETFSATTQVDALIEKLVEKNILTRQEAIKLKGEIAADEKNVREEGLKQSLPQWVQNIKLKGDFRLRYQYEEQKGSKHRDRGRIRYRLGIESKVVEGVKVGAGLASGGSDPRSTNQTLENTFDTPDIRLDYAYAQYEPTKWAKVIGGKYPKGDYLWTPTDMLWDSDINQEGGSLHLEHSLINNLTGFLNGGTWILDESSSTTRDPYVFYVQGGTKWKEGMFDAKAAITYYDFIHVKGSRLDNCSATNTGIGSSCTSGALTNDYNSFGSSVELGVKRPFDLPIPRLAAFFDYIHNNKVVTEKNDDGYTVGAVIGNEKIQAKGNWQFKYMFTRLEKDAFIDAFPDSDRLGGRTDIKGHEVSLEYGLNKNVSLALDYYRTRRLIASSKTPENLFQVDLNLKF